jgi:Domain of unknown function (DUF4328)/GYF domain 2
MSDTAKPVRWFYGRNGVQYGPFAQDEMVRMLSAGTVKPGDLVWRDGFQGWIEASTVPELSAHIGGLGASGMGPASLDGFRDPTALTGWLTGLLLADVVLAPIAMISGYMEYNVLQVIRDGGFADEAAREAATLTNDLRQGIIGMLQVGCFIATVVLFIKWIVRSNHNVRQLGATGLKNTPRWAAGWYFVPFANLWMPYRAMSEIWRASKSPATWSSLKAGAILPVWWALFLFDNFMGNIEARGVLSAKTTQQMIDVAGFGIFTDAMTVPACLAALYLVRQVWRMQMASLERLKATPEATENKL